MKIVKFKILSCLSPDHQKLYEISKRFGAEGDPEKNAMLQALRAAAYILGPCVGPDDSTLILSNLFNRETHEVF